MRADGIFIAVEVDDAAAADTELARQAHARPARWTSSPRATTGALELVERNLDECVLCRLCLDATDGWGPNPAVRVIKLYDYDAVLA